MRKFTYSLAGAIGIVATAIIGVVRAMLEDRIVDFLNDSIDKRFGIEDGMTMAFILSWAVPLVAVFIVVFVAVLAIAWVLGRVGISLFRRDAPIESQQAKDKITIGFTVESIEKLLGDDPFSRANKGDCRVLLDVLLIPSTPPVQINSVMLELWGRRIKDNVPMFDFVQGLENKSILYHVPSVLAKDTECRIVVSSDQGYFYSEYTRIEFSKAKGVKSL